MTQKKPYTDKIAEVIVLAGSGKVGVHLTSTKTSYTVSSQEQILRKKV